MRLATLAKEVNITPKKLQEFLEAQDIPLDKGVNTRLTEETRDLVIREFGESQMAEVSEADSAIENDSKEVDGPLGKDPEEPSEEPGDPVEKMPDGISDEPEKEVEVIRAPKIELPGLKVKGKIDLPEPTPRPEKKEDKQREIQQRNEERQQRKADREYKRMVAERKRKKKEEARKVRLEEQEKKEIRRIRYEKMVQERNQQHTTKARKKEKSSTNDPLAKPTYSGNIFQRFWKWLNTY